MLLNNLILLYICPAERIWDIHEGTNRPLFYSLYFDETAYMDRFGRTFGDAFEGWIFIR